MGATNFYDVQIARNYKEAYDKAVADALVEYGNDSYNGTISTTRGAKLIGGINDKKYSKTAEKEAFDEADKLLDTLEKWGNAGVIDCGVVHYEKPVVSSNSYEKEKDVVRGSYTVTYTINGKRKVKCVSKQSEANKFYTEMAKQIKTNKTIGDYVEMTMKKSNGNDCLLKSTSVKGERTERKSAKAVAIHKYILFGWAAC